MPTAKKTTTNSRSRATKKAATKAIADIPPVADSTPKPISAPVKRLGRPPKVKQKKITVVCGANQVELSFEDEASYLRTWKQLGYNVRSGQPVTVTENGLTYTFCKVDYIYG
mgnify:CR=1 FL=1